MFIWYDHRKKNKVVKKERTPEEIAEDEQFEKAVKCCIEEGLVSGQDNVEVMRMLGLL
jgi:hypothetical protein